MTDALSDSRTASAPAHQVVRSPEQVVLHLPVAGPASRILAYAIDAVAILLLEILIIGLLVLLFISSTAFSEWVREPLAELLADTDTKDPQSVIGSAFFVLLVAGFLLVQLVAEWMYFVVLELTTGGRSLGKRLLGLRVIEDGGLPLSVRGSLVRNLLRIVDVLPTSYLVGLVAIVVSPEGKRLGDLAAGTLVVRLDRPAAVPSLGEPAAGEGGFPIERAQLARLGAKERALLRQTLRRVESLDPARAEEALARAAALLCARIGYRPLEPAERLGFLRALLAASRRR